MNVANEEWSGLNRVPRVPDIIPGFAYPKPVQKQIAVLDDAMSLWADADGAVANAEFDLQEAETLDDKAFAESVLSGSDDPGQVHVPKAERKLKGARILAEARLRDANKAGRQLEKVMREHAAEMTDAAIEMARAGIAEMQSLMMDAAQKANEAINVRNQALAPLRFISKYTRGTYSFDASFPVSGYASFPSTREERILGICDDLQALKDAGRLFGDDGLDVAV